MSVPLSDADTVRKSARRMGDTAFRAFYERTAPGLHAYLARSLDQASAEDLLQESFIRYLRFAPAALESTQRKAYLYRIAGRLIIDHARRLERERRRNWKDFFSVRAARPSVELRSDVAKIFGRLKPRRRALLWLAYVEGFDHGEIAKALGISEGSVRVLLFRARRKMATLLTEAGFHDPGAGRPGRNEAADQQQSPEHTREAGFADE